MGNLTSADATTFCTLKSQYLTLNPIFSIIFAYFLLANWHSSYDFAPVMTIFPLLKMSPVVFGFLNLMMTAANLLGLYYVALPFQVIYFKSSLHPRLTVPTTFWILGRDCYGILSIFVTLEIILILCKL